MLTKKQGFPTADDLVICTVKKIQPHAVTVSLDEYVSRQGLIHISEISPGRIRNIRDFVREGKVVVCKVLKVNIERGYIDLSLRRVTDRLRRNKINEIKQEQIAEKILEFVGKQHKKTTEQVYKEVSVGILKKYDMLYPAFEAVVEEDLTLESLGVEKALAKDLEEAIRQRIKPVEVKIGGELSISTYAPSGVEDIKVALKSGLKVSDNASMHYLGAGKYSLEVKDSNFKDAEGVLAKVIDAIESSFKSDVTAQVNFERKELKA